MVRWDAGTIHDTLRAIRFEFAERLSAMTGKEPKEPRKPSANDATALGLSKAPEIWTFEPTTPEK
jgi:hypothetical protein